jgi:hypothetical protein
MKTQVPIRITPETPPVDFPCWVYDATDSRAWHRFSNFGGVNDGWVRNGWSHYLPDSPERPTCVPGDDIGQQLVEETERLGLYPTPTTPVPVTAPLPASEGTPRTDALCRELSSIGQCHRRLRRKRYLAHARTLERELAEAKHELSAVQLRKIDACIAWTEAQDELASLRTLLATAEKERDRLNGIIHGIFPGTAALHEILRQAGCVSVRQADYDELQALRARLTPSVSQSAEMEKVAAGAAEIGKGFTDSITGARSDNFPDSAIAAILSRHFTTPTQ